MSKKKAIVLVLGLCCSWCGILGAQNNNYWGQQFGPRSTALGGAVVSGEEDNSAVYYNPAALGFVRQSELHLSATAYRYEEVYFRGGGGRDLNLNSGRFNIYSQMGGGLVGPPRWGGYRFAFMTLARHFGHFDFNERFRWDLPSGGQRVARVELQDVVSESWTGLGVGKKINEVWSWGASGFWAYRHRRYESQVLIKDYQGAEENPSSLGTYYHYHNLRYNNIKLIFKAAVHGRKGPWRWGASLTLASIEAYGFARIQREETRQNFINLPDQSFTDRQLNLWGQHRTPLSLALGLSYRFEKVFLSLATEAFAPIDAYQILRTQPSNFNAEGETHFLGYFGQHKGLVNVVLGCEWALRKGRFWQFALRTDPSFLPLDNPNNETGFAQSPNLDLYHFSTGFTIKQKKGTFNAGLQYSAGWGHRRPLAQLRQGLEGDLPQTFIFGHSVILSAAVVYFLSEEE